MAFTLGRFIVIMRILPRCSISIPSSLMPPPVNPFRLRALPSQCDEAWRAANNPRRRSAITFRDMAAPQSLLAGHRAAGLDLPMRFSDFPSHHAARAPDSPSVVFDGMRWSYG